jgi:hypothetical protein
MFVRQEGVPMFVQSLFWYALAFSLAALEIEIEGQHGWAEKLPTWYRTRGPAARVFALLTGGKPLTGYHLWLLVFLGLAFHMPYFAGAAWSASAECATLARLCFFAVFWDYLWFILNLNYGWRWMSRAWWHSSGVMLFGAVPLGFVFGLGASVALSAAADFGSHLRLMLGCSLLIIPTVALAPFYHRWYLGMRGRDDRSRIRLRP